MPRPQKPLALKIQDGTFRQDRDGNAGSQIQPSGEPVMPDDLSPGAREHWDAVVPQLTRLGVATALDTPALVLLCETHALMQATQKLLADDPTCKDARIAFTSYAQRWESLAGKFGMAPADRAKLHVTPREGGKLQAMLASRHG